MCKYFVNTGKCPKQKCNFAHIDSPESKQHYLQAKVNNCVRAKISKNHTDLEPTQSSLYESAISEDNLQSRHARARMFAQWLASKFFQDSVKNGLESKPVIYDVAGGKGEIAFELTLRQKDSFNNDLQCIIVDPRKPNKFETGALPKWQKKMIKVKLFIIEQNYFLHKKTSGSSSFQKIRVNKNFVF